MTDLQRGFHIGDWNVYPLTGDLGSGSGTVHLEPKVMEVLVALAEQAEEVVLREALLDRVWGARAATSDEPLTRCIAQLRNALGDSSRDPQYIQTIPKRGYRLMRAIAPLAASRQQATAATPGSTIEQPAAANDSLTRSFPHGRIVIASVIGLALLALVAYVPAPFEFFMEGSILSAPAVDGGTLRGPASAEVQQLVRRGRDKIAERRSDSLHIAIEWLEDAIEIDADYGPAYVEISRAYALLPAYSKSDDSSQAYRKAYEWLIEGFQRDPSIRDATHGILAYIYFDSWKWIEAEREFFEALQFTPDDSDMWQWYSNFLSAVGRLDDAVDAARTAWKLDSDSPVNSDRLGVTYLWVDEDAAARAQFDGAVTRFPGVDSNPDGQIVRYIRDGNWNTLKELLIAHATQLVGSRAWIDPLIAYLQEPEDEAVRQRAVVQFQRAVDDGDVFGQYEFGGWVYLRQADRAFEKAFNLAQAADEDERQELYVEWLFTRETQFLRPDERFPGLLEAIGLIDYWDNSKLGWPEACQRIERIVCH